MTAQQRVHLTEAGERVVTCACAGEGNMNLTRRGVKSHKGVIISATPLAMDDLIQRLQLSKGSASQGLKFLRNIGAVRTIYVAGDRRVHYEAVAELRNLATRFLRDQIVPHLDNGHARLERIAEMIGQLPEEERSRVNRRVVMLQSWERNARRLLPLLVRILGR